MGLFDGASPDRRRGLDRGDREVAGGAGRCWSSTRRAWRAAWRRWSRASPSFDPRPAPRRRHLQPRRQPRTSRSAAQGAHACAADRRRSRRGDRARVSRAPPRAARPRTRTRSPRRCSTPGARASSEWIDVDAVLEIARGAGAAGRADRGLRRASDARAGAARCRIGLAHDEAFHFYYDDNLRRLEALGAELVPFSPMRDARLPAVDGLYLGGGYPEVHAEALAANAVDARRGRGVRAARAARSTPSAAASCTSRAAIRTLDGRLHEMVGLFPCEAVMAEKLEALGYVEVELQAETPLGPPGTASAAISFATRVSPSPTGDGRRWSTRSAAGAGRTVFREGYRIGQRARVVRPRALGVESTRGRGVRGRLRGRERVVIVEARCVRATASAAGRARGAPSPPARLSLPGARAAGCRSPGGEPPARGSDTVRRAASRAE